MKKKTKFKIRVSRGSRFKIASRKIVFRRQAKKRVKSVSLSF